MAKEKCLLKIFSGPNQGAEVALAEEELIIGSSPDCDLILSDTLVSAQHLKVVLSKETLSVIPLAAPVYIDGYEIPSEPHSLSFFQIVSLGTTHFIIGPVGGEWPLLSSADVPELNKMEVVVEAAPEEGLEGKEGEKTEEGEENEEKEQPKKTFSKEQKRVMGSVVAIMLILVIGMVALFFMGNEADTSKTSSDKPDIREAIKGIMVNYQEDDAYTLEEKQGIFVFEAWVEDTDEKDSLGSSINQLDPSMSTTIWSQEQLISDISDLLTSLGVGSINVNSITPGTVELKGYYSDGTTWSKVKAQVQSDIVGIKVLQDRVITARKLQPILNDALSRHDLETKIQMAPQETFLLASGRITKDDVTALKEAMDYIEAQVGFPIPIKNNIQVASPLRVYLHSRIGSVIIGEEEEMVITKEGQILFEGGILPDGYVIEKITREGITLKRNNNRITLKIGEDENE